MPRIHSGTDYDKLAKEAAGNYKKFDSFASWAEYDNEDDWCIVYASNRDSTLLDQSNAHAIEQEMERYTDPDDEECCGAVDEDGEPLADVRPERHSHWACGYVDGYAIRVYAPKQGDSPRKVTQAFKQWCDIQSFLENFCVLDDEYYSEREMEATEENIKDAARYAANNYSHLLPEDFELPKDHVSLMWKWFSENDQSAIENRDDMGGYPSEEECLECFKALGWTNPEMEDGVITLIALTEDADREAWHPSLYRPNGKEQYLGERTIDCAQYYIWKNEAGFEPIYLAQRTD